MIASISIQGYKSIRSQRVHLRPLNIIIGDNGIGKTNFLSAFELMHDISNRQLQSYVLLQGGANGILYNGKKTTDSIRLKLVWNFDDSLAAFDVTLQEAQDTLIVKESMMGQGLEEDNPEYQLIETFVKELSDKEHLSETKQNVRQFINQIKTYHFQDTGAKSPIKQYGDVSQNRYLRHDGSNIASYLYYLQERHPKHFKRIERIVASVSPFFECFVLSPNRLNLDTIRLEWKQKGVADMTFNAYQLSDGTLRFICLATLLMQPNPPKTILIDEPELGLHPKAISKFCELVKVASVTSQIIISTQSVNVVDNFTPSDIIVAQRENNATTFKRLDEQRLQQWLQEYSMGELWEMNVIANGYE